MAGGGARREPSPPRAVRLSLTDRCDLACVYCRPHRGDGYLAERLDLERWWTLVRGLMAAGIRRVRLTGGEPLLSPHVVPVVARLAELGLDDLALTTNGTRLAALARPLREAGLRRVNISMDSLDAARFARLTRGGSLSQVLEGIEAAREAGFEELKLNTVVLRGENDDELASIARFAWRRRLVPRFLELMAIGEGATLASQRVPYGEMRQRLAPLLVDDEPRAERDRGPARYVAARHDGRLRAGFITGASDTYCGGCDRLRVASDGVLRPCLAREDGVATDGALRQGDWRAVERQVAEAWRLKPDGETFRGCTEPSARLVSIRAIGG
jgi:cyclic pyranopterin phosphate synthase